jgi:hypothetical protein
MKFEAGVRMNNRDEYNDRDQFRIIDGKDAVSFLVRVKEYLEDPRRLFLNL